MKIGDMLNITGYDIAATATCDYGQVLVLSCMRSVTHRLKRGVCKVCAAAGIEA